jgi:hypothetical protein
MPSVSSTDSSSASWNSWAVTRPEGERWMASDSAFRTTDSAEVTAARSAERERMEENVGMTTAMMIAMTVSTTTSSLRENPATRWRDSILFMARSGGSMVP